jgi:hypothetical protein
VNLTNISRRYLGINKMKIDLTTGTWQDNPGCPVNITLVSTSDGPPVLSPEGYLGLLLFYLGSTMTYKRLCLIFGITPTVSSHLVNWMLKKVVRLLQGHPFARVNFPNGEKMREFANMVRMREPMVTTS